MNRSLITWNGFTVCTAVCCRFKPSRRFEHRSILRGRGGKGGFPSISYVNTQPFSAEGCEDGCHIYCKSLYGSNFEAVRKLQRLEERQERWREFYLCGPCCVQMPRLPNGRGQKWLTLAELVPCLPCGVFTTTHRSQPCPRRRSTGGVLRDDSRVVAYKPEPSSG